MHSSLGNKSETPSQKKKKKAGKEKAYVLSRRTRCKQPPDVSAEQQKQWKLEGRRMTSPKGQRKKSRTVRSGKISFQSKDKANMLSEEENLKKHVPSKSTLQKC